MALSPSLSPYHPSLILLTSSPSILFKPPSSFLPSLHFATSAPTPRLKLVSFLMEATNLNLDSIETWKLLDMKIYNSYSLIIDKCKF